MASAKEKFDAAVQAIKSLPKDGPFQPSYGMMKRFYGLFKQATEGPCCEPKPAFWNAIKRAKWEAWTVLGQMSSEEAQETYVREMLKIVETMPQTDQVQGFLKVMGPFFEMVRVPEEKPKIPNGAVPHLPNGGVHIPVNGHLVNGYLEDFEVTLDDMKDELPEKFNNHRNSILTMLPNGSIKKLDLEVLDSTQENTEGKMLAQFEHGSCISESSHPFASRLEEENPPESVSSSDTDEFCDTFEHLEMMNSINQPNMMNSFEQPDLSTERRVRFADPQQATLDQPITSTPITTREVVVTQAQVHHTPIRPTMAGAEEGGRPPEDGGESNSYQQGRRKDDISTPPRSSHEASQSLASRSTRSSRPLGGASGGHPPGRSLSSKRETTEHIIQILERLQRDMNSVLVRLNTLEKLALNRHQSETQTFIQESLDREAVRERGSSWWVFGQNRYTILFLIFVWPFVINFILKFVRSRRLRRH